MNNKGITLIEIIISIVLISIVLIFLFSLLITVNDINYESEVNSTYLINKSLILKNIEEDFEKADIITVSECNSTTPGPYSINELYSGYGTGSYFPNNSFKAHKCLKFDYVWKTGVNVADEGETKGFLGIYYYKNKENYVISYIRGKNRATRELPEFEKNNVNADGTLKKSWDYTTGEWNQEFYNIYVPIIGKDGKDYSLNISYYNE